MVNKSTIQLPDTKEENKPVGSESAPGDMAAVIKKLEAEIDDLKENQSTLQQSMAFQKVLLDAIPVPIYYKDTQGRYTGANTAFVKNFGISEQELIGKKASNITSKQLADFFFAKDSELFQNPGQQEFEITLLDYNQAPYDVIFNKSTFLNANGDIAGIIGVIQDISERKQAENALRTATEELEHFFSSTIDLLCIADAQGYFRRLNREWEKVLGYSIEELEGRRFLDFIHPDDIQPTLGVLSDLANRIEVVDFINRIRCKDGAYRWIEWRSIPVGDKIYTAARDITERINTENALRENEERYRNFVANASEGIFRADFTQPIRVDQPVDDLIDQCARYAIAGEVNAAFSAMYGLEPEQMVGRPMREFSLNCGVQIVDLLNNKDYRIKDREEIEYSANGQPINVIKSYYGVVENGVIKRVWGVQHDITQRKRAEELIALQHDLAKSLNAVSGFDEGLRLCLETAIKTSGMDSGGIYLYNELSNELNLVFHQGLSREFVKVNSIFKSDTPNMQIVMSGNPVYSQQPMLGLPNDATQEKDALGSIAILPISYQNRVIGCMNIASHTYEEVPIFSRGILETITAQVGNVISRLQSEEALRESENRFRSIFDHAQDGILVADKENQQILFGNQTISQMLGYSPEELNKLYVSDIHPASAMPDVWEQFIKSGSAESPTAYVTPIVRKDGSTFIAEIVNSCITLKGRPCLAGMFRDITERKQVENALRENEALISSLFTAMPAGVSLLKDRVLLKVNHALCRITGFSEQEILGKTTRQLYPNDEEYLRIAKEIYSEMEREGLGIGEAQLKHKNGALIDVLLCLSPLDSSDISKGSIATILDISDRVQAEKALRENEALISSLFGSVPIGLALIKDRVFVKVNNTLCKMSGYSEAELLGSVSQKLYVNDDEFIRAGKEIYGQIEKEGIGIGETHMLHKNGAIMDVLLCLSPLDLSDVSKGITATILDITDHKQAEAALRESERKYRSVIENIQDVFYRADLNGRLLMGSPSGARMFGLISVAEMIGMPLEMLWADPKDREIMMTRVIATGSVKDFEAQLKRKDGSTFWGSFTTHLFYDNDGNLLGTEGIIRDNSERKKAEKEIRQLNEDLEQRVFERTHQFETAIQELEAFSYSVSHDLRAPLRAINGYANILKEDYSPILDEEGNRICAVISKETQRMSRLIDDLLSFSRIGRVDLQPYSIDMQALVNSVFLDLTTPAEQQRISFQVAPLEFAVGDTNLLRQVWMNLISNAIKFTSQKEQAIIQITSEHNENAVIYSIKDNGAGFDMRYAQNLFGVFNRLHSDKEFEGTGVGLAIVHRIINRHGGQVWAEGEVDNGAIFNFSLPKREIVS